MSIWGMLCHDQPLYHLEMMFFYNKLICPKKVRWTHYHKIYQVFVMGILIIYSVKFCFGSANKLREHVAVDFEVRLASGWGQTKLTIPLRWTVPDIEGHVEEHTHKNRSYDSCNSCNKVSNVDAGAHSTMY